MKRKIGLLLLLQHIFILILLYTLVKLPVPRTLDGKKSNFYLHVIYLNISIGIWGLEEPNCTFQLTLITAQKKDYTRYVGICNHFLGENNFENFNESSMDQSITNSDL